jgi:hypothetical protein
VLTPPRVLALLLAAPLAFAPAASAEPIVSGCWGAGPASLCDPYLRVTPVQGDPSPTPVCAGTCTYVGVPTVEPEQARYQVCLVYRTPSGQTASECAVDVEAVDAAHLLEAVPILLDRLGCDEPRCGLTLANVQELLDKLVVSDVLCGLMRTDPC